MVAATVQFAWAYVPVARSCRVVAAMNPLPETRTLATREPRNCNNPLPTPTLKDRFVYITVPECSGNDLENSLGNVSGGGAKHGVWETVLRNYSSHVEQL